MKFEKSPRTEPAMPPAEEPQEERVAEIVKRGEESRALATPPKEEKVLGLSQFRKDMQEQGRMILPYLKIVQSMSEDFTRDGIQPGHFRNSLTGEDFGNQVDIVPVQINHWRRLFSKEREILCSSNDAVTGFGEPGGACKSCPFSAWEVQRANGMRENVPNIVNYRQKKDEELIAPLCSEQFVFPSMILSAEWKVPGVLVFHKTYLKEGLRFYSLIEWSPVDTVYKVVSEKQTNDKGTWFVPKITIARKLKEEEVGMVLAFRENLKVKEVEVDEVKE